MPIRNWITGVALWGACVAPACAADHAGAGTPGTDVDPQLVTALREAIAEPHWYDNEMDALVWLADMSQRLRRRLSDPFYRVRVLKFIYQEARRYSLQPELVLALIEVESGFNRYAISATGARGLMQVMPFWKKEIGHPRDSLFDPGTNIRYGCQILRHYLDQTGDLSRALHYYNGRHRQPGVYSGRVYRALKTRWQRLLAQR